MSRPAPGPAARVLPLAAAAIALAGWWALSTRLPPVLLPGPAEALRDAIDARAQLAEATWNTAVSSAIGLAIAAAAGVSGGVLFLRSRWLEAALYPYALLVQTVPIVAIAALLVVWLGYGGPVAVTTAAIVSFFPVLTSANVGLRAASEEQVELLRLYGAGWWQELIKLRLPGSLPFLFAGLRTAVGLSVIGAIVGEFVGSNGAPPTLGYLVLRSSRSAQTGLTFAAIACATGLALAAFAIVRLLEARLIGPWHGDPQS